MKLRLSIAVLASLAVAACAGDAGQEGMAEDAAVEMSPMAADEAAIDQIRMDYVEHYNMHHPDMVAALYADSAFWLGADGRVSMGKEEILAGLTDAMAGSPTLDLTSDETMVMGDNAVARGQYTVSVTPEGAAEPMTLAGAYMTYFVRVDGEWKINGALTNYNAAPPEGLPYAEGTSDEPPPEEGTMGELITAYETHFNLGHASMVADLFTEDGVAGYGNLPVRTGRAGIETTLNERLAISPQIDLHDVGTIELGGGWALDGGWYELTATTEAGPANTQGGYLILARQAEDGTWKIHWAFSNSQPATM